MNPETKLTIATRINNIRIECLMYGDPPYRKSGLWNIMNQDLLIIHSITLDDWYECEKLSRTLPEYKGAK